MKPKMHVEEQNRSPAFRIERQTWQVTRASSIRRITLAKDDGGTSGYAGRAAGLAQTFYGSHG
jgi:hypothetical protein